jgi:SH3-like domain-containing protein
MAHRALALPPRTLACAIAVLAFSTGSWRSAVAAEFRATVEATAVLYDAPSAKAKPLFVLGRDTPLEVIVPLQGWVKVRDAGGTIAWIEQKALTDRRSVVVRGQIAEVFASPDAAAALVFRAEHGVLLELAEPAATATTTATPGWVKVKHRDGQSGFVRIAQIFGL